MTNTIPSLESVVRPLFEQDVIAMSSSENLNRDSSGRYIDCKIQAMWAGYALASAFDWSLVRPSKDA